MRESHHSKERNATSIMWPIAKSPDGGYTHIQNAERGQAYSCPECFAPFVARMGQKNRWHFAHYPGNFCTGEGVRHSIAKHLVAYTLSESIRIPFHCGCQGMPTRPYAISFSDVEVENDVLGYRIDVTARLNQQLLCVEVVDSHPTEPEKVVALGDTLVEININDLKDEEIFSGDSVRERLIRELEFHLPARFTRRYAFFHSWKTSCYRCKKPMPVVFQCRDMWSNSIPAGLLEAMRKHANLIPRKTSIIGKGYFANVCSACDAVQGDWFLQTELLELCVLGQSEKVETHLWVDKSSA